MVSVPRPAPRPSVDTALAERLFDRLRQDTADTVGVTRASYGPGEQHAHDVVRAEAERLGLTVATDAACNLYATLPGATEAPAIVIGSHLDSVPRGGNFDGAAGVLMGLAVVSGFRQRGEVPSRPITVMAIRAEESTWFNASYIGSRAALGQLLPAELDEVVRSDDGLSLGHHVAACGGDPEALRAGVAFLHPSRVACFIEPHIEQGPVLLDVGVPAGIVTGIRGSLRHRAARCLGTYAHSGATPRPLRQDAVLAVADLVTGLDALWQAAEAAGDDLTITVGQLMTDPAEHGFSKVAGRVDFALDMRSQSTGTLEHIHAVTLSLADRIARERNVRFDFGARSGTRPAIMDDGVVARLRAASGAADVPAPLIASGAGHDAAVFAHAGVASGMLFIRNAHGSHNPDEAMDLADFSAAAEILAHLCRTERP